MNEAWQESGALRAEIASSIPRIVELLRRSGFDALPYKRSRLEDWIVRRMVCLDLRVVGDYISRLQSNETELSAVIRHVLNGATSFFRDSWMWKRLELVLDRFLSSWPSDRALRVWNPACSTGEEAFSTAILVEEAMRRHGLPRYVVAASDIDEAAVTFARAAVYSSYAVADVPCDLRERFFSRERGGYVPHAALRESVLFACRDVFTDFPISNVDLLVCRNLAIYLRPNYRDWLVSLFHYVLRPGGVLFLGPADPIGDNVGFSAVDGSKRIYARRSGPPDVRAVLARPDSIHRFLPIEARRRGGF